MTEDEFWSATPELKLIHQWARARYAAPWAVLGAVLLRVAASTGPHVQLPGVIGGPASLNLGAVFVGASGAGKGVSDKVARAAWPATLTERPIGSGEGIAAMFVPPKKEGADRTTKAILSVPEIDTLTGVAGRQGSILLAQLKSTLMGELIGQSNASEATTRVVQAHTYRCCLSIGAQPGHAAVIFNDTTGGTPQRMLWFPTTDPTMPADRTADPGPLDTALPGTLGRDYDDEATPVVTVIYGTEIIAETIIAAHLARQRGEGEALDGHALLTRCKVAAVLAIMGHRIAVSASDWELSGVIMAKSDQTRAGMIEHAKQAARAKIRDKAMSRVAFDDFIEGRHTETVRNRIVKLLADGSMPRGALRRAMGKQHYREAFDAVLPHLEKISQVVIIEGGKVPHYALNPEFTGEPEFTPQNSRSNRVNHEFTSEPLAADIDVQIPSSAESPEQSRPTETPLPTTQKPPRPTACKVCYVDLPAAATRPFCDDHDGAPPPPPPAPKPAPRTLHVIYDGTTPDYGRAPGSGRRSSPVANHSEETA